MNHLSCLESFIPNNPFEITRYIEFLGSCPKLRIGEKHHILPRSLFPDEISNPENIICLCPSNHLKAHYHLCLCFPSNLEMLYAFGLLCGARVSAKKMKKEDLDKYASIYENYKTVLKEAWSDTVPVLDDKGKTIRVLLTDPRWLSGQLTHATKGKVAAKSLKTGKVKHMSTSDPDYNSGGEWVNVNRDTVEVVLPDGTHTRIDLSDPRWLSGEAKSAIQGKVFVIDQEGKCIQVSTDDPRYLTGEFRFFLNGIIPVKDTKTGKRFSVSVGDPRLETGELAHVTKGLVMVVDLENNKRIKFPKGDPRIGSPRFPICNQVIENTATGERVCTYVKDPRIGEGWKHLNNAGTVPIRFKDGTISRVSVNDPRYLSGELKHASTGRVQIKDEKGVIRRVYRDDPKTEENLLSGKWRIFNCRTK